MLKKIFGLGVALVSSLVICSATYAATQVTLGEAVDVDEYKMLPLTIESTDISAIGAFDITFNHDTSKATLVATENIPQVKKGIKMVDAGQTDVKADNVSAVWTSTTGDIDLVDNKLDVINVYFQLIDPSYDLSKVTYKINQIAANNESLLVNGVTTVGSYVKFTVPKTQTSSIAAKPWITGMTVSLDGGKTTAPIVNYTEDGDNYVFYVVLQTSTAQVLSDVTLLADCAATETGTADAQFELASKSNVNVLATAAK